MMVLASLHVSLIATAIRGPTAKLRLLLCMADLEFHRNISTRVCLPRRRAENFNRLLSVVFPPRERAKDKAR